MNFLIFYHRYGRSQEEPHHAEVTIKTLYKQLVAKQEEIDSLREKIESMKPIQQEVQFISGALNASINVFKKIKTKIDGCCYQDERFRTERLEEQINDLTELHQNEVENLKQAMIDMEEKVQYQSEERLRDIHEMLEHCQTKVGILLFRVALIMATVN